MPRIFATATLWIGLAAAALPSFGTARADEGLACLNKAEQRAAITQGQAVTLGSAIRSAHLTVRHGAREVVNARLCRRDGALIYVLTALARNGKVTHTTVDASSGKVVDAR
jgi:uncharacterized membrane protein YkoI